MHTVELPGGTNVVKHTTRTQLDYGNKSLTVIEIYKTTLLKYLNSLRCSKVAQSDDIPSLFVGECATYLITPLLIIYNQSLRTCIFPSQWKATNVPIFISNNNEIVIINHFPFYVLSQKFSRH